MPERTWESVAERLGISPDAGWPETMHAVLDRIDEQSSAPAVKRASKSSRSKEEPSES